MPSLLEIGDAMRALDEMLAASAEEGGDITAVEAELNRMFADVESARDQKVDAYCALIREKELRAAARKEESERLQKRVKIDTNQVDFLKSRLKQFFQEHGLKKLETERFTVSIANNGGRLPITIDVEPQQLPVAFQRVSIAPDIDKIYKALEAGEDLLFVTKGERGSHLRIK